MSAMVVVLASLATLLLAANKKKEANVCSGVQIRILPEDDVHYVEEDDVLLTIEKRAGGTLVNRAVSALDLDAMEAAARRAVMHSPRIPVAWNLTGGAPLPGGAPDARRAGGFERGFTLREIGEGAHGVQRDAVGIARRDEEGTGVVGLHGD